VPSAEYTFCKYVAANSLTIRPATGETINGAGDVVLTDRGEAITLWAITGEGWLLLNHSFLRS
jgi:hypothetical protein